MNTEGKQKLAVGQTLWIVRSNRYRGGDNDPQEVKISKVGNKYFELEGHSRQKFNISDLLEVGGLNYKGQCYLSLQEILDERETEILTSKIRNIFKAWGKIDLTLIQLRKIMEVIETK